MQTKTLHIVRHGKAVQDMLQIDDGDRPLIERGIVASIAVAKRFIAEQALPDVIVSSHAARALHTAHIFARELGYMQGKVLVMEDLYFRGVSVISSIIKSASDDLDSIMIVGHNPDLSRLAKEFGAPITEISTSGVVSICFQTDCWSKIGETDASYSFIDKKEC